MIQAKDLRIGNWVFYSHPKKSYNYCISPLDLHYADTRERIFKPIPLTPEILEKCGFEEVYKSPMHSTYWMEGLSYYFWYEKGNQYADCKGLQVNCKHLHQLQNLYFALTGEELTITYEQRIYPL